MGIINSGVKQWVFQRIANALFITFGLCLLCVFLASDGLTYDYIKSEITDWKWYFAILLVFACLNSILAGWQIDGDYAEKFGLPGNVVITLGAVLVSLIFLFFGLRLLFG